METERVLTSVEDGCVKHGRQNMDQEVLDPLIPVNNHLETLLVKDEEEYWMDKRVMKDMRLLDTDETNYVWLYGSKTYCQGTPDGQSVPRSSIVVRTRRNKEDDDDDVFYEYDKITVLSNGFPFTREYTDETILDTPLVDTPSSKNDNENTIDVSTYRWFKSVEGTLIKAFNVNDKWYVSTSRKLDAFKSRWAAVKETFGGRFAKALRALVNSPVISTECVDTTSNPFVDVDGNDEKKFTFDTCEKYLDKENIYLFIVKPGEEERIVCSADEDPSILHVATIKPGDVFDFDDNIEMQDGVKIPKHIECFNLKTRKDLAEYVFSEIDITTHQGIIGFSQTVPIKSPIKIYAKEYQELYNVRGNVPSLSFRWLMLRCQSQAIRAQFLDMYPQMRRVSGSTEIDIYLLCKILHTMYIKSYIEKTDLNLRPEVKSALYIIHASYLKTRIVTKVGIVNDILTYKPNLLNKLLKLYRSNLLESIDNK